MYYGMVESFKTDFYKTIAKANSCDVSEEALRRYKLLGMFSAEIVEIISDFGDKQSILVYNKIQNIMDRYKAGIFIHPEDSAV